MSSKGEKSKSRFDLGGLRSGADPRPVAPAPEQATEPEVKYVKSATYIRADLKVKLKQAAAKESTSEYLVLERLIEAYLKKEHPSL